MVVSQGRPANRRNQKENAMTRLDSAKKRLEDAVVRLETAIAGNAGLSAGDHETLRAELEAARKQNQILARTAGQVSARVDKAIGKIRLVLEA
jgi:predicted  nucleic acid-binding Zn-ribbon protein